VRVLIAGGAGYIGSTIASACSDSGINSVIVDSLVTGRRELAAGRETAAVKARLQRMNPVTEQAEYNKMFGDLVGLEKRRKALLDRAAGL